MTGQQDSEKELKPQRDSDLARRAYPRNPLGVIALFVSFIDAVATVSLKFLLDAKSPHTGYVVVFIIAFPTLIVILFFSTLWLRRESLYGPSDFREDANFMNLFTRIERVDIRTRALQLDPQGDPDNFFAIIPELLASADFETVIALGRAFVKVKRYSQSLTVFGILPRSRLPHETHLKVIAFTAYSLNALGRFSRGSHRADEASRPRSREG